MMDRTRALLERLPPGRIFGAEVGVFRGKMSAELLRARPDLFLHMVDSWRPSEEQPERYRETGDMHAHLPAGKQEANAREARRKTAFAADRCSIIEGDSVAASFLLPQRSLDFVFLDADHSYGGVSDDLRAWHPIVRPGGLLGGHDYSYEGKHDFAVREAVDEFVAELGLVLQIGEGSTWFVRKP